MNVEQELNEEHALEKIDNCIKIYIIVDFGLQPLPDEFILCESYENLLRRGALRLADGVG